MRAKERTFEYIPARGVRAADQFLGCGGVRPHIAVEVIYFLIPDRAKSSSSLTASLIIHSGRFPSHTIRVKQLPNFDSV